MAIGFTALNWDCLSASVQAEFSFCHGTVFPGGENPISGGRMLKGNFIGL